MAPLEEVYSNQDSQVVMLETAVFVIVLQTEEAWFYLRFFDKHGREKTPWIFCCDGSENSELHPPSWVWIRTPLPYLWPSGPASHTKRRRTLEATRLVMANMKD
ncbi:hypothetical protein PoB_001537400 [Plakobranchus ocellatus]|uniref:Uncharacterized protein n=1 Tax=Plakobranchus ocellatus TaxID=259542 RepID=A0AAV3Z4D5_9GAST|nr:hypothetical protein PoB_001537400 [Plakobranchus ocellatus]